MDLNLAALEQRYRETTLKCEEQQTRRRIEELRQEAGRKISDIQASTKFKCDEAMAQLASHGADLQLALQLLQENSPEVLAFFEKEAAHAECSQNKFDAQYQFDTLVRTIGDLRCYKEKLEKPPSGRDLEVYDPYPFGDPRNETRLLELGWVQHVYVKKSWDYRVMDALPERAKEEDYRKWLLLTDQGKSVCAKLAALEKPPQKP